jgi:hypothetical protein
MLMQILEIPDEHPDSVYQFSQQKADGIWYVLQTVFKPDEEASFVERTGKDIAVPLLPAKLNSQNRDCQVIACCLALGAKMTLGLENEPIDAIRIFIRGPLASPSIGAAFRRKTDATETTTDKSSSS